MRKRCACQNLGRAETVRGLSKQLASRVQLDKRRRRKAQRRTPRHDGAENNRAREHVRPVQPLQLSSSKPRNESNVPQEPYPLARLLQLGVQIAHQRHKRPRTPIRSNDRRPIWAA